MLQLLAVLVWATAAGATAAFPATPQFTPFVPCPIQGCNVSASATLPTCQQYESRSCCTAAQAAQLQPFASAVPACVAAAAELRCAVLCSPFQSQFVTRDPLTLGLAVRLAPAYCASLALVCGLSDCRPLLPPPLELLLDPAGLSQSTLLLAPVVVPLGSVALPPPSGLLHGGLLGSYEWRIVAGDIFGQLVPGADAAPALSVPGFASSVAAPLGNGSYGGSYAVTTPGRYALPVTLDGNLVANAPFELVFLAPTPCLSPANTTVPTFMAVPPLPVCGEYGSNGCCDAGLVATLDAHWAYLAATFGPFPPSACTQQLQILACGMACSPRNLGFVDRSGQCANTTNSTGNSTGSCDTSVLVCTTLCDDVWSACMDVVPAGSSSTVAVLYGGDRLAFCAAQFPPQYLGQPVAPVFNTTTNSSCFFGLLREPACANTSYVTDRVPLVAGVSASFTIVAQDCFGNPRISGGDTFVVAAPPGVQIGPPVDNGDGTYTVPITAFHACLDACVLVSVTLGGGAVQNAPFRLNVLPGCPFGPSSLFAPVPPGTQPPFRFAFVAYDEWLNLAYTASESDFVATLADADGAAGAATVPLRVLSLGCNGSFVVEVQDTAGLLNASACLRFCLDALCARTGTATRVTCATLCNETSFIFFSDTGTRIDMVLIQNATAVPPQLYGEFDCCLLVTNCALLGPGAYCVLHNQTDIEIFLPYGAPVCSSGTATCDPSLANLYLDCTLLNVTGGACSTPLVTQLLSPNPSPVVRLAAPDLIVRCAGLTVDAAATTNAGGRPGRWRWQLLPPFAPGDNSAAINAFLAAVAPGSNRLELDSVTTTALFVENATYTLQATLTNHLDQTGSAAVTFRVLPDGNGSPVLFISPSSPVAAAVMQSLGYHAFVTGPGCTAQAVPGDLAVPTAWVMPLAPPQPLYRFLANRTVNQNSLELPPATLPVLSNPSLFQVWALSPTAPPVAALRTVTPRPRAPYAYAASGSPRLFVLGEGNLQLRVSAAFEWNQPSNASLAVVWSCATDTGAPCFSALQAALYLPPQPSVAVPPFVLGLGVYVFRATVTSALGGGPTVLTLQILTNGTAPQVAVDWYNADIRGGTAPGETLSLLATVDRDLRFGDMETEWRVASGNAAAPLRQPGLPEGAAFPPGSTGSNANLRVRVAARDSEGEGYAEYAWTANDRPNGGTCAVSSVAGSATLFFLRCSNWEDLQNDPLSYVVNVLLPGRAAPLPLSFGRWFAPYFFFELQPAPYAYTVQVAAVDQTDHGRTLLPLPPLSLPGSFPACPETAAAALATATLAHQTALDSARLVQRAVAVCSLLRSAPGCDAGLRAAVFSDVLALLGCLVRSEPSRERSALAANVLALCLDGAPLALSSDQYDRAAALLTQLADAAGPAFAQEGTRAQPVVQAVLQALDLVLAARAPVFATVSPAAPAAAAARGLLEQLAAALASDLRAGEAGPSCRAARLAVSAGWWLPVPEALYGFPSVAALRPTAAFLANISQSVRASAPPRLGSARLLPTAAVAANYTLAPQRPLVLPASWTLRFLFPAPGSAQLVFAVAAQPVVCAALSGDAEWDQSACAPPEALNASHAACLCATDGRFLATLPLAQLPDGPETALLVPPPAGASGAAVPLVPTLPAGLAVGALLVLALAALAAYLALRGARPSAAGGQIWVSPGVGPGDLVPADNRVRVPLPAAAAAGESASQRAVRELAAVTVLRAQEQPQGPAEAEGDSMWVSDEEEHFSLLRSEDVAPSEAGDGFYDTRNDVW